MVVIDERSVAGYFELDERNGAGRRGVYLWRAAAGAFVALCLGLPLYSVWEGLQTHQWQHLHDLAQFPLYAMVLLPWAIGMGWFPWRTVSGAVSRLGRAAAAGNDILAPLAETQPMPLENVPDAREVLGPLRGVKDGMRVRLYWTLGIVILVFGLFLGVSAVVVERELPAYAAESSDGVSMLLVESLALALPSLALIYFGIRLPILGRRLGRGLSVTADETGLTWRDTRWYSGQRRIMWSEVEAFITIMCRGSGEPPTRVYALKAGGTTLLWSVKAFMSRQEYAASERLLRLVVTRTQLHLRDLTAISRAAVDELIRVSPRRGARPTVVVAQSPDTSALLDAILPRDFIAESARKARRVLMLSVYVGLPYTVVLIMSTVVPWFWGGH
jgi:hypothetical protein